MSYITTITLSEHLDAKSAARLGLPAREYSPGDQLTLMSDDAQSLNAAGYVRTSTPVASVPMLGGPNTWTGTQDFTGATVTGIAGGTGGGPPLAGPNTWTGTQNFTGASTPGVARLAGGNTFTGTQDFTGATVTGIAGGGTAAKPWQFAPESYGAKGDGKLVADVATTSGSAVITSATAGWTTGDVGKPIMINGGRAVNDIALITTIASRQSATQVTLATPALATNSGLAAIWGTDDTAKIQQAIDAARDYAVAHDYYAEVIFQDRYYVLAANPTQTSASPAYYNTQLRIPYAPSNVERKLVIAFIGAGDASNFQFWMSTTPNMIGTCLVSMHNAPPNIDATYLQESVLGGPSGYAGFTGNFVNTKAIVKDLAIWCTPYTNQTALDLTWISGCHVEGFGAHVFATPLYGGGARLNDIVTDGVFQNRQGVGVRLPAPLNNADVWCPTMAIEGFTTALWAAEHVRIGNLKTIYNNLGIWVEGTNSHGVDIVGWSAEVYNTGIRTQGSGPCPVHINMVTEDLRGTFDVRDDGNALRGVIHWVNPVDSRDPQISGAAKVKVIDDTKGPGKWAAQPAVPASTTPRQNTAWRDAMVVVSGGTGVTIAVDGTTLTGVTSGAVMVPSGKNITLTYTAAPTWLWWLL